MSDSFNDPEDRVEIPGTRRWADIEELAARHLDSASEDEGSIDVTITCRNPRLEDELGRKLEELSLQMPTERVYLRHEDLKRLAAPGRSPSPRARGSPSPPPRRRR